ncbi:MAG: MFS transporter [Deltaproteobacteria bacterium]|nr:MFS transporter [Deltaproteobacteria bacterium]
MNPNLAPDKLRYAPLLIFWSLWLLNFLSRTAIPPMFPVVETEFHLIHTYSGLLFTSISVGYALSIILAGHFAATLGHKKTILISGSLISLAHLMLWSVHNYFGLLGLFFILGVGCGAYLPSAVACLTRHYNNVLWGRVLGFHDTAPATALLIGPFFVAIGLGFIPWRGLLTILALINLALLALFWRLVDDIEARIRPVKGRWRLMVHHRAIRRITLAFMLMSGASLGVFTVIPLMLVKEMHVSLDTANTWLGVSRLGGFVFPFIAGVLADRLGYHTIVLRLYLVSALLTILVGLISNFTLLILVLFFQGTIISGFFPLGLSMASLLTDVDERPAAVALVIFFAVLMGMGLVPLFLGVMGDLFTFRAGIVSLGVVATLGTFLLQGLRIPLQEGLPHN